MIFSAFSFSTSTSGRLAGCSGIAKVPIFTEVLPLLAELQIGLQTVTTLEFRSYKSQLAGRAQMSGDRFCADISATISSPDEKCVGAVIVGHLGVTDL